MRHPTQNSHENLSNHWGQITAASERPEASAGAPPAGSEGALSVTRHRQITNGIVEGPVNRLDGPQQWTVLSCGLDTLDLGIDVDWGLEWPKLCQSLQQAKENASGTQGIPWRTLGDEPTLILPSGKPNYRFHLAVSLGNLFIANTALPVHRTPNVHLSLSACALWCLGWPRCIYQFGRMARELGGRILNIKPSRVDLCADFMIPDGLTLDFLRSHTVARSPKRHHYEDRGELETYYVGDPGASVQLRIYDKAREVLRDGRKNWFKDVWGIDEIRDVWRVEFQLRREFLRNMGICTLGRLNAVARAIWAYLTEDWASLRLHDDSNTTRRSVHPWWADVQAVADRFGTSGASLQRITSLEPADADWYVAHIIGCLTSLAALRGHSSMPSALDDLSRMILIRKSPAQYEQEIQAKALRTGRTILPTRGTYPEGWDTP